jgi:hypothetical protein
VAGKVCEFLVDNGEAFDDGRFRCALMLVLGDWSLVHADPRYQPIGEAFTAAGVSSCGDWQPSEGECCRKAR